MKECFKCGVKKDLNEYYRHKEMSDGHLNKCKTCTKKDSLRYRYKNLEACRLYEKSRANHPHRVLLRKRYAETEAYATSHRISSIKWVILNPEKRKEAILKWNNENKEKRMAQGRLNYAVKIGKMIRDPCINCGNKKSHGHHLDYARPLDVIWLCSACHKNVHKLKDSIC